jgi:hypothetical protein
MSLTLADVTATVVALNVNASIEIMHFAHYKVTQELDFCLLYLVGVIYSLLLENLQYLMENYEPLQSGCSLYHFNAFFSQIRPLLHVNIPSVAILFLLLMKLIIQSLLLVSSLDTP